METTFDADKCVLGPNAPKEGRPEWVERCTPRTRVWVENLKAPVPEDAKRALARLYGMKMYAFQDFYLEGGQFALHRIGERLVHLQREEGPEELFDIGPTFFLR